MSGSQSSKIITLLWNGAVCNESQGQTMCYKVTLISHSIHLLFSFVILFLVIKNVIFHLTVTSAFGIVYIYYIMYRGMV